MSTPQWQFSPVNYAMLSPNPCDSVNLHMNQMYEHNLAWNNIMFSFPRYDFTNFSHYGNGYGYGNSFLTNPGYTLAQMSWGTPSWNNTCSYLGWGGGPMATTTSTADTAEERSFKRKYNVLLSLCKQLKEYKGLSNDKKDELQTAINNTRGSYEERFNALKEVYDSIGDAKIKKFLYQTNKIGTTKDINGSTSDEDSLYNRLLAAGYERTGEYMDANVSDVHSAIQGLTDNNPTFDTAGNGAGIVEALTTKEVLDFISSWNTKYSGDSDTRNIINYVEEKGGELPDSKDSLYTHLLVPLVNTLIDKSEEVDDILSDENIEEFDELRQEIRELLDDSKEGVASGLAEAFDKLYVLTRKAAMLEITNDLKGYYGEVDPEIFNNELFVDKVDEDLKNEGLEDIEVTSDLEINEEHSNDDVSSDDDDDSDGESTATVSSWDKGTAEAQIDKLISKDYLEPLTATVNINGADVTVYKEKYQSGDSDGDGTADYTKVFCIINGEIKELKNLKWDGDSLEEINENIDVTPATVKASDIASAQKDAKSAADKTEKLTTQKAEVKSYGKELNKIFDKATTTNDRLIIKERMDAVNKDNVYEFLQGYYDHVDGELIMTRKGLVERLYDESIKYDEKHGNKLGKSDIVNFMEDILAKAKELGLENDSHYIELGKYKENLKKAEVSYLNESNSWTGLTDKNKERIDKEIKALYREMNKKMNGENPAKNHARKAAQCAKWSAIGATAGAAIGSFVPVVGTGIGAIVGGAIGIVGGLINWFV